MKTDWKEIMEWNICPNPGYARVVARAVDRGLMFREEIHPYDLSFWDGTLEEIRLYMCDDRYSGPFAWVTANGVVIYVGFGCHDPVALTLLGETVEEVEKKCARITAMCHTFEDAMEYVEPRYRTDRMQDAVVKFMCENRGGYWPKMEALKGQL